MSPDTNTTSRLRNRLAAVEWPLVILFCSALIPFALLARVLATGTLLAVAGLIAIVCLYGTWSYHAVTAESAYARFFSLRGLCLLVLCYSVAIVSLGWVRPTVTAGVHLFAIALIFLYYWVIAFAALYHTHQDDSETEPDEPTLSVSILVPAYNEAGYIQRTVSSLIEAEYPAGKREIIVIDDGSTDSTYAEACAFDSELVTVVTKENGGKYSALNYGLLFASNELILTVDADSVVETDALVRMVAPFHADATIGAVAGAVTIWNRDSMLTRCQQLEYTVGINVYRRMLDLFGVVMVVPGCLGAYRRSVLDEIHGFDPQTLTEDFDITLKVLRAGYTTRTSSAKVYTEAPDSLGDLYNQRLRWYRGNYMTMLKHLRVAAERTPSFFHRFSFPLRLVEMFFLPLASWIILAVIILLIVSGYLLHVLSVFIFFTSIIFLIAALGIYIEGEDWRLLWYTPFFVIGYKHFHDALLVKSLVDVLLSRDLSWTRATRIEQRPATAEHAESSAEGVATESVASE